ncbi:MAG: hypothetical protein ABW298_07915 [Candidatus Binatia bacterium]
MASFGAGGESSLKVHTKTRIVVNGEEYANLEAMPPEVRRPTSLRRPPRDERFPRRQRLSDGWWPES